MPNIYLIVNQQRKYDHFEQLSKENLKNSNFSSAFWNLRIPKCKAIVFVFDDGASTITFGELRRSLRTSLKNNNYNKFDCVCVLKLYLPSWLEKAAKCNGVNPGYIEK